MIQTFLNGLKSLIFKYFVLICRMSTMLGTSLNEIENREEETIHNASQHPGISSQVWKFQETFVT